ncbi:hypothetical protein ACNKHX_00840 [Shigella flexneri]
MNKPMFAAAKGSTKRWVLSGVGDMMLHPFHLTAPGCRILFRKWQTASGSSRGLEKYRLR